jgi:uncharacterized protein YndB with AHSA1/START domain
MMATATLTPDNDAILAEIFVAAPPARVFEAISDPKQTAQWWGQKGLYKVTRAESDVRPGGTWLSSGTGDDGTEFTVQGKYLEVDPPRLLVHTWNPSFSDLRGTVVRWELEPHDVHGLHGSATHRVGTGTLVRIRHSGFAGNIPSAQAHGEGWKRVLGWMQSFVERGETIATRPPVGS